MSREVVQCISGEIQLPCQKGIDDSCLLCYRSESYPLKISAIGSSQGQRSRLLAWFPQMSGIGALWTRDPQVLAAGNRVAAETLKPKLLPSMNSAHPRRGVSGSQEKFPE